MVNTILFYTADWKPKASYTIGSGSSIGGVCFDDPYFWITNGTDVQQYIPNSAGVFSMVSSFSCLGFDSSMTALTCLCTDGIDLWVAYQGETILPPPFGLPPYIRIFKTSKTGKLLVPPTFNDLEDDGNGYLDMTMIDNYLYVSRGATSGNSNIHTLDVTREKVINVLSEPAKYKGLAHNGVNFYGVTGGNAGRTIDYDHHILSTVGIGTNGTIDFGTADLNIDGFQDKFNGEWICLAHR